MSFAQDRTTFVLAMFAEGMPGDVALAIMRDATTLQRLATEACNRPLTAGEEKRENEARARIASRCLAHRCQALFSGDPRGACVKIKVPSGRTNDWGGEGICVPTRRF